jgi:hypothetical protein
MFVLDEEGVDESGEKSGCDGYMGCRTSQRVPLADIIAMFSSRPQSETPLLTANPLNYRHGFGRPALRHGSLNSLFQVALHPSTFLPPYSNSLSSCWARNSLSRHPALPPLTLNPQS